MVWSSSNNNRKALYMWKKNTNPPVYFTTESTTSPGPKWTSKVLLGYFGKTSTSASMTFGTIARNRALIPLYTYYNADTSRVYVALENTTISGFTKKVLGYIVNWTEITNN
jgi:hypothetical protein